MNKIQTISKMSFLFSLLLGLNSMSIGQTIWVPHNGMQNNKNLYSIVYNLSSYTSCIAVGDSGEILSTSNGYSWVNQSSGIKNTLFGMIYNQSLGDLMIVGDSGKIISQKGSSWNNLNSGISNCFKAISYGTILSPFKSLFVAVGNAGTIIISPGIDSLWVKKTSGTKRNLNATAFTVANDGNFVIVGDSGTILTSSNATDWTAQNSGVKTNLNAIISDGNLIVGDSGTILTSTDGKAWTRQTSGTKNSLRGVFCIRPPKTVQKTKKLNDFYNFYFAVGDRGTILVSTDGIIWDSKNSGTTRNLNSITWYAKIDSLIAVGDSGTILTSYFTTPATGNKQNIKLFNIGNTKMEFNKTSKGYLIDFQYLLGNIHPASLTICNDLGRQVAQFTSIKNNTVFWNTAEGSFVPGMYVVKAGLSDGNAFYQKMLFTR
jgi:photosystem II stability/assembly factor-like uncharacterized protein